MLAEKENFCTLKLVDLGDVKKFSKLQRTQSRVGTPDYAACDIFENESKPVYGLYVDIFSLGRMFLVLLGIEIQPEQFCKYLKQLRQDVNFREEVCGKEGGCFSYFVKKIFHGEVYDTDRKFKSAKRILKSIGEDDSIIYAFMVKMFESDVTAEELLASKWLENTEDCSRSDSKINRRSF